MKTTLVISIAAALVLAAASVGVAQNDATHATVSFEEQASGGHAVTVEAVSLPQDGFIAIHDATLLDGNVLGSVIGVQFLAAGSHENVRVYLSRNLTGANETLVAMPHKDTNANRLYDFVSSGGAEDGPFIGGPSGIPESFFEENAPALAGQGFDGIVAAPATVQHSASVEASDQTNSGKSILVDFVDLSQGGYIAVHDATLVSDPEDSGINSGNLFSSVVGVSDFLEAGVHHDVVIKVGNNCAGCTEHSNVTGTLIPMAHKETNNNRQYDFITSEGAQDGPFTGQPGTPLTAVIAIMDVQYGEVSTESFPAQATGGHAVVFPEVYVVKGGYAAVHDATLLEGEVLSSVIGVSKFLAPGLHRNVTVELNFNGSSGIDEDTTLIGMLHRETNNNTSYDFVSSEGAEDGPYFGGPNSLAEEDLPAALEGFGGINAVPAEVTVSAAVSLAPVQFSRDGRSVQVEWVDLSETGFVALHDASLLADPGANVLASVVGVSGALQPGLHRNVTVQLDGSNCAGCTKGALNATQLLIAMPHKDTNGNGAYDFITSEGAQDGPFTTSAATRGTVGALDLNIVVATGNVTAPFAQANETGDAGSGTGGNNTQPPTTTTPTGSTPPTDGAGPAENADRDDADTPGFGVLALALGLVAAALVLRGRRRT